MLARRPQRGKPVDHQLVVRRHVRQPLDDRPCSPSEARSAAAAC